MKKYIVMECHLSYAVVLDEHGRFIKVANRHYEVGQTVTDIIEMQVPQPVPKKKNTSKWMYSLAAMAACMVLMVTSIFQAGQTAYASVYMTINPEIRIDVNRKDRVVGLDGVNADGNALIEGYDYREKNLDLVMDELVDRAIDMDYLHEGGQISLVLDADSDEWVISHSDTLTTHLNEYLDEKLSVSIEVTGKDTPDNPVIIPVVPEGSEYGESDYGEGEPTTQPPVSTEPADSNYDGNHSGDGQTDYDSPNDAEEDDPAGYDDSSDGENSAGDSNYDDGQTDYSSPDSTEAASQPDSASSDSSDDGKSDYEPDDDDSEDQQSDYDLDSDD